jgi:hypothetical protein
VEEENLDEPKKPWDNLPRFDYDNAKRTVEIVDSTLAYFHKNKKAQKYLAGFQQDNIERALESYAWQKARWLTKAEYTEYWYNHTQLLLKNEAEECLGNIQQRKLFQKNCEWRAGLFNHPAIECSDDFKYWEYNILNCPFIDPITVEDVELYIEFLNQYFGENLAFLGHWQDYDTYCTDRITVVGQMNKEEDDEEDDDEDDEDFESDTFDEEDAFDEEDDNEEDDSHLMPPWYIFWDERRGAGNYRLLTDIRTDKEREYSRLAYEEERQQALEKFKKQPPDKRPWLSLFGRDKLVPFITQYEKPSEKDKILKAFEVEQKVYHDAEEEKAMYWVKEAWHDLSDCWENFPIAPNITDWKKALIATAKNWNHHKLIRMIPIVYDEYVFRMETGIAHPYDHKREDDWRKMTSMHKEKILRGREIKGEPRDFNFY